jgi:orotidine-5'-phosphate decarboxylase
MTSFAQRFVALSGARSPLCLGLDPSCETMAEWGLGDDADDLRRFCGVVMEAAGDRVAVVKPQSAFFERFGPAGMHELARTAEMIGERGALSLIDCKRGDFTATMEGYAEAMLGPASGFGGDAMTVTAYLGFGALRPVLDRAVASDGRSVADALADDITAFNAALGPEIGPIGAVVGATIDAAGAATLSRLPKSLILAPGVGAQGGTFEDIRKNFGPAAARTLPSASRSILREGPSVSALREAIERHRDAAWRAAEPSRVASPLWAG